MQERYLGDTHDFNKFIFLKFLSNQFRKKIGLNWYLVDTNNLGDKEVDEIVSMRKYSIDNDEIILNNSITDVLYSVSNSDTINIVSFAQVNQTFTFDDSTFVLNENNCVNTPEDSTDCINQLTPVINAGYNDEIFNFDITIDQQYLNQIQSLDSLNDIIKFKFQGVQFIV